MLSEWWASSVQCLNTAVLRTDHHPYNICSNFVSSLFIPSSRWTKCSNCVAFPDRGLSKWGVESSGVLAKLDSCFFFSPSLFYLSVRLVGWLLLRFFSLMFCSVQVNLNQMAALHRATHLVSSSSLSSFLPSLYPCLLFSPLISSFTHHCQHRPFAFICVSCFRAVLRVRDFRYVSTWRVFHVFIE